MPSFPSMPTTRPIGSGRFHHMGRWQPCRRRCVRGRAVKSWTLANIRVMVASVTTTIAASLSPCRTVLGTWLQPMSKYRVVFSGDYRVHNDVILFNIGHIPLYPLVILHLPYFRSRKRHKLIGY